jgi:hypothetical protein
LLQVKTQRFALQSENRRSKKMKKSVFVVLFLVSCLVFAQEKKMAIGLGPEWNMNSRHNFAGGAVLSLDFNLPSQFALGLTATGSDNFNGINVIEGAVLLRRYFLNNGHTGLFAQADAGIFIILEDGELTSLPLFGIRGGFRHPLGSFFYIEPYGRLGYPFAFGIGLLAGILW